jgi:hypothetical protein
MSAEDNVAIARRFLAVEDSRGEPPDELCAPGFHRAPHAVCWLGTTATSCAPAHIMASSALDVPISEMSEEGDSPW